jgi:hypothetical protein
MSQINHQEDKRNNDVSPKPRTIETRTTFTSYDSTNRLVVMEVKDNAHFDAEHAWENKAAAKEVSGGNLCGLLFATPIGKENEITTTAEMRSVSASKEFNEFFYAVALVSHRPSMKVLGNFYLKINRPVVPTRFFGDRELAMAWLKEQQFKR